MGSLRNTLLGFGIGAGAVASLCLLAGAVQTKTRNVDEYLGGPDRPLSVACSDSGDVVYVADRHSVFRSTNKGQDWQIVLTNGRYTPIDR